MLARQLASLEKKCIELEARCKVLEATRGAATAVTDSSIPTNIRTGGSKVCIPAIGYSVMTNISL